MDTLGLQGMIDNLPTTVDSTFASNLNSPAIDFGMPKPTGNYFNGSTDLYSGVGGGSSSYPASYTHSSTSAMLKVRTVIATITRRMHGDPYCSIHAQQESYYAVLQ